MQPMGITWSSSVLYESDHRDETGKVLDGSKDKQDKMLRNLKQGLHLLAPPSHHLFTGEPRGQYIGDFKMWAATFLVQAAAAGL